jgi:hypothetical protein
MNISLRYNLLMIGLFFYLIASYKVSAQCVVKVQDLSFGTIIPFGSGGTIIVSPDYIVSKTGDIILTGSAVPAIFEIDIKRGENLQLSYPKKATLNGEHGGVLNLVFSDSYTNKKGIMPNCMSSTRINLGGTLTIGSSTKTPVGHYSGNFQLCIIVNHN